MLLPTYLIYTRRYPPEKTQENLIPPDPHQQAVFRQRRQHCIQETSILRQGSKLNLAFSSLPIPSAIALGRCDRVAILSKILEFLSLTPYVKTPVGTAASAHWQ